MGNETSTLAGAVATAGTGILAGATFGQVETFNNAVKSCAKYTGESFMETSVRHIGEAAGKGVATAATTVAAGVTLGKFDSLNEAMETCAKSTVESSKAAVKATASNINNFFDGLPVVGHAKGAIHYLAGDNIGGDKAMKSASRTVAVMAGGAGGFVTGGPVGAAAGGIAGGAAMDSIISKADSAVHKEWRPYGQIAAWEAVANAKTNDEFIDGVISGVTTTVCDALSGIEAGKRFGNKKPGNKKPGNKKPGNKKPGNKKPGNKKPGNKKPGNKKPSTAPRGQKAPGTQGNVVGKQNPPVKGKSRPSIAKDIKDLLTAPSLRNICETEGKGVATVAIIVESSVTTCITNEAVVMCAESTVAMICMGR